MGPHARQGRLGLQPAGAAPAWLATPPPLAALHGGPLPARVGNVRVGTASWTDRTLLASNAFYPPAVRTPEHRLRYYAHHFPVVEVDATYYALPNAATAQAWVERTPPDFAFGIKAYAAMTEHPIEPHRLDRDLQPLVPAALRAKRHVYPRALPPELVDEVWRRFAAALVPLRAAGKLSYVLLQLPPWFVPARATHAYLEALPDRLPRTPLAVEFRAASWFADDRAGRTIDELRRLGLVYVCVDEPQGTPASVPPLAEATSDDLAVVRLHGRNRATWTKRGATVHERFGYAYSPDELAQWLPRIRHLAARARGVNVLLNNCHRHHAVQNAKELAALLANAT